MNENGNDQPVPDGDDEGTAPVNETNAQKFKRLGDKRTIAALEKIRLIGNLAGSGYDYTPEQVDKIENVLMETISSTINRFRTRGKKEKPTFEL